MGNGLKGAVVGWKMGLESSMAEKVVAGIRSGRLERRVDGGMEG
jgi:hypothetical protein